MAERILSDSQQMIDAHGDALYRYALLRVRDPQVSEDLVQETFLAALEGTYRGTGEGAERRWMIGIMKHKIVDYYRRISREAVQEPETILDSSGDESFLNDGHWKPGQPVWHGWPDRPDGIVERREFWESLTICLEKLSPKAAQVFSLREMDELDTEAICRLLKLTPTNFGVILHRARKQLRDCLALRYFGGTQEGLSS